MIVLGAQETGGWPTLSGEDCCGSELYGYVQHY